MKTPFVFLAIIFLLITGCTVTVPPCNYTNATANCSIPAGYEVKDYCKTDGDCVRLEKCCDCGLGEYVNIYNQKYPECPGPRCLCATALSKGLCQGNKCIAVASNPSG